MALDRWIALIFVVLCCVYGYAAFFTMDQLLPPFMQRNPVWPSTFPKLLSVLGALAGLAVLLGLEKPASTAEPSPTETIMAGIKASRVVQAGLLLAAMAAFALSLRPLGFLLSATLFLIVASIILGERKFHILVPVAALSSFAIWWLVERALGIFLRPLPWAF